MLFVTPTAIQNCKQIGTPSTCFSLVYLFLKLSNSFLEQTLDVCFEFLQAIGQCSETYIITSIRGESIVTPVAKLSSPNNEGYCCIDGFWRVCYGWLFGWLVYGTLGH